MKTENIPQAQVIFGHAGIDTPTPIGSARDLMEIMSGGFGSRLMTEVREKRGLAYGVWPASPLITAPWSSAAATRNDRVADSLAIIRRMAAHGQHGPSPAEIAEAAWRTPSASPIAGNRPSLTGCDLGLPISYLRPADASTRSAMITTDRQTPVSRG